MLLRRCMAGRTRDVLGPGALEDLIQNPQTTGRLQQNHLLHHNQFLHSARILYVYDPTTTEPRPTIALQTESTFRGDNVVSLTR